MNLNNSHLQYDVSLLRPAVRKEDIVFRGGTLSPAERVNVKKALRTLHCLEIMATNVYRFQLSGKQDEFNRELLSAMCNEQTHISDFLVRLYEYGMRPSFFRWFWWIAGFVFGFCSRLCGRKAMLKIGIWLETKAVHHYSQLIACAPWDEATRQTLQKDQADELGHIASWQRCLKQLQ